MRVFLDNIGRFLIIARMERLMMTLATFLWPGEMVTQFTSLVTLNSKIAMSVLSFRLQRVYQSRGPQLNSIPLSKNLSLILF